MASEALIAYPPLPPVRLLREDEVVKVHYLGRGPDVHLDPTRPVEVLPPTATDDETTVEVLDEDMMAVRQIGEDGSVNTLCLSPRLAVELSKIINSFVMVGPTGTTWLDGRDAA